MTFQESEFSKRSRLADCVPLSAPFSIQICVCAVCNLHCEFCAVSKSAETALLRKRCQNGMMEFFSFCDLIDNIANSFGRVKQILLTGDGEPLLNPQIAEMIAYAVEKDVADRVDVLTNGVPLSNTLSEKIINARPSYLRISVNGLSDDDYFRYCGRRIDFDEYVDNIRYFFDIRGGSNLYKNTKLYCRNGGKKAAV